MNTEDIAIESMQKLSVGASQDLSRNADSPRARFADLPAEVIEVILNYADKCYPLLLLCKQTCIPAGVKLYSKGPAITTEFPSRMRPVGFEPLDPFLPTQATLLQLFCGMDIKEPSPTAPFGRSLKMRFMRGLPGIHHHLLSEKEYDYLSGALGIQRRVSWDAKCVADLLKSLLVEGLKPFPALLDLRLVFHPNRLLDLHPYNCAPANPFMVRRQCVVENLTALCKPERFEWCLFALGSRWGNPLDTPLDTRLLKFPDGHIPREVHHYVSDEEDEWWLNRMDSKRSLPPIVHGARNVVHVRIRSSSTVSEYGLGLACSHYLSRLLKVVEQEEREGDRTSGSLTPAEQESRAKTRWHVQCSFRMVGTKADADVTTAEVNAWLGTLIDHLMPRKSTRERISEDCVCVLRSR
ncbi:hypothetical protein IAT38_004169 [Cryptococcus sp. DSM 104549]